MPISSTRARSGPKRRAPSRRSWTPRAPRTSTPIRSASCRCSSRVVFTHGLGQSGELEKLLAGGEIEKRVDDRVALRDLDRSPEAVWSFLLFTGYLKATTVRVDEQGDTIATLAVPNKEVEYVYRTLFRSWMEQRLGGSSPGLSTRPRHPGQTAAGRRRCQGDLAAVASLMVATSDFPPGRRVAFRFVLLYTVLYVFPFPIGTLPGTTWPGERYQDLWNAILPWIGKRVFRLDEVPIQPTGSGDTAAAYLQVACVVVLAALGTAVWSWIRRFRPGDDRTLMPWLLVYLRYWLAATLITYGAVKILKSQFPFPTPERLLAPFGQMSPMGLLWRFMGYSTAYTVFTGLTEVIGGALLFFRRTTTLGALVIAGVMANVVMLNLSYDVPVKLYSSHLLLAAIFLLLPDLRRLANVLVLNRPAAAADHRPPDLFTRFGRACLALKIAVVALMVGDTFHMAWSSYTKWGGGAPRHALYGAYEVESFEKNGVTVPPMLTEATRWRRVAVSNSRWFAMLMDDTRRAYWLTEYDAGAGKLTLGSDEEKKEVLSLTRPDEGHLLLEGTLGEDRLVVRLRKIDLESFGLVNRGFRWVSEEPFNR